MRHYSQNIVKSTIMYNNEMFDNTESLISIVTGNEANEFKWSVNKL
jgi:hypothetical protein